MAEEEKVDPKIAIDKKCQETLDCAMLMVSYEKCQARIEAKGHGTCEGQYMDYVLCVDTCVSRELFHHLK